MNTMAGIEAAEDRKVCILGLGYVGLTLGVALADVGFRVTGIEVNQNILDCLAEGRAHFSESGLEKRLRRVIERGRFTAHAAIPEGDQSTVYVITVGTPVDDDKKTKLGSIQAVAHEVARVLKPNDLVILRSTVRVGISRQVVMPILDRVGVPYQIAFCPERTVEGKAIEELRSLPQVVGGNDTASALRAGRFFHMLTPSIVRVSSLEAAEMIKLVNNTHRDIMFAFANEIASAAEAAGLSAMEVIRAANLGYPRGGVPMPGPVGGPCLEKDPYIFAEGLAYHGFTPELSLAGRRLNELLPERATDSISRILTARRVQPSRIAVLGLAFKGRPETSDLRGTLAGRVIDALRAAYPSAKIVGWDPLTPVEDSVAAFGVQIEETLQGALSGADVAVIQNNHQCFKDMDFRAASAVMAPRGLIYDLWAQNEGEDLPLGNGVAYGAFGSARLEGGDEKAAPGKSVDAA